MKYIVVAEYHNLSINHNNHIEAQVLPVKDITFQINFAFYFICVPYNDPAYDDIMFFQKQF